MADTDVRVLVVDDEEPMRRVLTRIVEAQGHRSDTAVSTEEALAMLDQEDYALVLADVNMPSGTGLDLIEQVAAHHGNTATVVVTRLDDPEIARTALETGAYGYVIKPFETNEITIALVNALRRRQLELESRSHREKLEKIIRDRTGELWTAVSELERAHHRIRRSWEDTIYRLSVAAEFRDDETAAHIHRMSHYCELLASRNGADSERAELIRLASVMHDVGKIGIPDSILLKPGALTDEERATMETHAELGFKILEGSDSDLLQLAAAIALTHHERIDGTGYPKRLSGDEVPIEGRIAAIADVFDALTTDRVYRRAFPLGKAVEIMREGQGSHFDGRLLELFLDSMDEVLRVKEEFD